MFKKVLSILLLLPTLAFAAEFVEGKDYQVVAQSPNNVIKGPTVTEFFSYGCPWCYKMEEPLNEWSGKLGKSVKIDRVPVVYKSDWAFYAKAYYTAKTLALAEKLNPLLFKAIQEDKQTLNTNQAMINFFAANGVDREIAKSAFESSPTINTRVNNGMALMAHYQINGVPAFVINNRYKTDLSMAGSPERLMQIMSFLMKRPA